MNEQHQIISSLTCEEQELLCFCLHTEYHTRLARYWQAPQVFARRTVQGRVCLSTTDAFRHYLQQFIRSFSPEQLLPNKNLWVQLEKNGTFSLRLGRDGEQLCDLSEADSHVFQYLCFLQLRRFWDGVRKHCRFPAPALPVMIRDFSGRLDEGTDYEALLHRAGDLSAQIIVLDS